MVCISYLCEMIRVSLYLFVIKEKLNDASHLKGGYEKLNLQKC